MRAKKEEQRRARLLRVRGQSMRLIANELGVSISSVSLWTRDVSLPTIVPPAPVLVPEVRCGLVKRCARCEQRLPIESFSRHPQYGHQHWCKECFLEYLRGRGELHSRQTADGKRRRRAAARLFVDDLLARSKCVDCGETDPLVFEFDHVEDKQAVMSKLIASGWSIKRLQREIALCEVVCVNCHRRRTASRGASWRTDPSILETSRHLLPGERRNMQFVRETLMTSSCVDCGLDELLVLEFDHIGPKRANVVQLARRGCSLMTLEQELAQCEIRCGNCHRRRTRADERRGGLAA
jgi:hypothetical protein